MDFSTEAQKKCYENVLHWLKETGEDYLKREDEPIFSVNKGSAVAHIGIWSFGHSETIINVRSYVVYGTELTEGLLAFLLHENDKLNLGAFGLDDENNIFLEHTILGNTSQKAEFEASLFAILSTSDKYDDEIVSRWGGLREADR